MITDVHCHFIPDRLFRFVLERPEFDSRVVAEDAEAITLVCRGIKYRLNRTFFDRELQLARMDELGIDRAILSLATPLVNYYLEPEIATAAARLHNEEVAGLIAQLPQRFGAWAFLPMQDPNAAAAELRRCVVDCGFTGGHLATNVRGVYLSDERFEPILDVARELDTPLFLHPVDPPGRDRTSDYELTVVAGYLFDSTVNILRMICSGFLERHRDAKLICAHTGAFSLMLRNRMQREIDTNPSLSSVPRNVGQYLEKLYFDTVCFEPGYLRFSTTIIPPENLLLGSDAPFPLGEPDPVNFVRNALSSDHANLALSANFRRMTGG